MARGAALACRLGGAKLGLSFHMARQGHGNGPWPGWRGSPRRGARLRDRSAQNCEGWREPDRGQTRGQSSRSRQADIRRDGGRADCGQGRRVAKRKTQGAMGDDADATIPRRCAPSRWTESTRKPFSASSSLCGTKSRKPPHGCAGASRPCSTRPRRRAIARARTRRRGAAISRISCPSAGSSRAAIMRRCPMRDVPPSSGKLRERDAIAAMALEFCILTATRTSEVLGARWSEVDIKSKVWTIPAARMKAAARIAFRCPTGRWQSSKSSPKGEDGRACLSRPARRQAAVEYGDGNGVCAA